MTAAANIASVFTQPELNRHVGSFLGDDGPGLRDQVKWSLSSKAMAGRASVRIWCLGCLHRWLRYPWTQAKRWLSSRAMAAAETPFTVPPDPQDEYPFGWSLCPPN